MRKKSSKFIRVFAALALVFALMGLMATPAVALSTTDPAVVVIEKDWYKVGDSLKVTVDGGGVNTNPFTKEWIVLSIVSTTGGDTEQVNVEETGSDTDKFEFTIELASGTAATDGKLQVATTDTITASSTLPSGALDDTAGVDNTAPVSTLKTEAGAVDLPDYLNASDVSGGIYKFAVTGSDTGGIGIQQLTVSIGGGADQVVYYDGQTPYSTSEGDVGSNIFIWSVPPDGVYNIVAKALDALGNVEADPDLTVATPETDASVEVVTVDSTVPSVTATWAERVDKDTAPANAPLSEVYKGRGVTLWVSATDATAGVASVWVDLDDDDTLDVGVEEMTAELVDATATGNYSLVVSPVSTTVGTQSLNAYAVDNAGNTSTAGVITYEVVDDTTGPSVSLSVTYVKGAEALLGDVITVTATITDDVSGTSLALGDVKIADKSVVEGGAAAALSLEQDAEDATKWTKALTVGAALAYGTKTVTVSATDNAGSTATEATVDVVVAEIHSTYRYSLAAGWTLMSVPQTLADESIESVFAGITTVDKIATFQGNIPYVATYADGAWDTSDLATIEDGKGYLVHTTADTALLVNFATVDPLQPPAAYEVGAGWSLIGYTSTGLVMPTSDEDDYLVSLGSDWVVVYEYPSWDQGRPGATDLPSQLALGAGYWLYTTAAGVLVP